MCVPLFHSCIDKCTRPLCFFYHNEKERRIIPENIKEKLTLHNVLQEEDSIKEKNILYKITQAQQSFKNGEKPISRFQRDHLRSLVGKKNYSKAETLLEHYLKSEVYGDSDDGDAGDAGDAGDTVSDECLLPHSPKWVKDLLDSPECSPMLEKRKPSTFDMNFFNSSSMWESKVFYVHEK